MALRTSTLLATLGQEGALDVVLLLLSRSAGSEVGVVAEIINLPQSTVTRRLQELEAAGLVDHERRGQPYRLREPGRVSALLRDASELSGALLELDGDAEEAFRKRLANAKR